MNLLPQNNNIADIRAAADIVEETTDEVTYLGFCRPGTTEENAEAWSILKITQTGIVKPIITRMQWAEGFCSYHLKWSEKANYEYKFRKF